MSNIDLANNKKKKWHSTQPNFAVSPPSKHALEVTAKYTAGILNSVSMNPMNLRYFFT